MQIKMAHYAEKCKRLLGWPSLVWMRIQFWALTLPYTVKILNLYSIFLSFCFLSKRWNVMILESMGLLLILNTQHVSFIIRFILVLDLTGKVTGGWHKSLRMCYFNLFGFSSRELTFWIDLIDKYLKPLEKDAEKEKQMGNALKELRNQMVFSFLMINSIWTLTIFLLQENKSLVRFFPP